MYSEHHRLKEWVLRVPILENRAKTLRFLHFKHMYMYIPRQHRDMLRLTGLTVNRPEVEIICTTAISVDLM